jgi:bifunctional UDP-N-acetylglucosamine pyrophosphorylase/glucosamine-1-phosphate N-acetyltransferase
MSEPLEKLGVVIMAAGKGTRMKSGLPKALHLLGGKPLVMWTIQAARTLHPERIVVVVGHGREMMEGLLAAQGVLTAIQEPQLGTGHALACAADSFRGFDGALLVLSADVPAILPQTLTALVEARRRTSAVVALLSCRVETPGAYGRIVRHDGEVTAIVEAKDATAQQLAIREVNAGVYVFDARFVFAALPRLGRANAQGEYYLTDVVALAADEGRQVAAVMIDDTLQIQGVNTAEELALLERALAGGNGR